MKFENITDVKEMEAVIGAVRVCYVSFVDGDEPYVLPFNFGYNDGALYLHGNGTGRKDEILRINNKICVAFSTDEVLHYVNEEVACSYSMKYRSVILKGLVHKVESYDDKILALNNIMNQYVKREFSYNAPAVNSITVYRIETTELTGRKRG